MVVTEQPKGLGIGQRVELQIGDYTSDYFIEKAQGILLGMNISSPHESDLKWVVAFRAPGGIYICPNTRNRVIDGVRTNQLYSSDFVSTYQFWISSQDRNSTPFHHMLMQAIQSAIVRFHDEIEKLPEIRWS